MNLRTRLLLSVVVVCCCAADDTDASMIFYADLSGDQEVGPVVTDASGTGTFVLNDDETELSYSVEIFGLDIGNIRTPEDDDNIARAHIHAAPAGLNGGVVFGVLDPQHDQDDRIIFINDGDAGSIVLEGIWDVADEANGAQSLASQLANLKSSGLYFNVHTPANPGGEIRGQIIPIPEPSTVTLGALAAFGTAMLIRRRKRTAGSPTPRLPHGLARIERRRSRRR